jgi:hypothetical protein
MIEFLFLQGKHSKAIHPELIAVLGEEAVNIELDKLWYNTSKTRSVQLLIIRSLVTLFDFSNAILQYSVMNHFLYKKTRDTLCDGLSNYQNSFGPGSMVIKIQKKIDDHAFMIHSKQNRVIEARDLLKILREDVIGVLVR